MSRSIFKLFIAIISLVSVSEKLYSQNQTEIISPILPPDSLPFDIAIRQSSFVLPAGIHSGSMAVYHGKWIFIGGRTNGLHGFDVPGVNNFPVSKQNILIFVVDPKNQKVYYRALNDPASGLNQELIDQLSSTSPQFFFTDTTLYISGGYGVDSSTGKFNTKSLLTAIDLKGLVKWVTKPSSKKLSTYVRYTSHPLLQVTGGYMTAVDKHLSTLLVFGQNFKGFYDPDSNGEYTRQVRTFRIIDQHGDLAILPGHFEDPNPDYRRRDLNVVPIIRNDKPSLIALSGVFTLQGGIWTVPVFIKPNGCTSMSDPNNPETFKQGMNNYVSSSVGLYSHSSKNMYIVLLGGLSFGYFDPPGVFQTDPEIPFVNQVTTVKIDRHKKITQYIMNNQFPFIASTGSNPGNQLLFGTSAYFIPAEHVSTYSNGVVQLDKIKGPTIVGYIVGGIMSTLPNTNVITDSTASPYIFEVVVTPN